MRQQAQARARDNRLDRAAPAAMSFSDGKLGRGH